MHRRPVVGMKLQWRVDAADWSGAERSVIFTQPAAEGWPCSSNSMAVLYNQGWQFIVNSNELTERADSMSVCQTVRQAFEAGVQFH